MGCGKSKEKEPEPEPKQARSSIAVEHEVDENKRVNALLIIDLQRDFIDGSLAVEGTQDIIEPINTLREEVEFDVVAFTLDSHPADHCSYADNHPGAELFSVVEIPSPEDSSKTMPQVMWPRHCEVDTPGWEMPDNVLRKDTDIIQRKGQASDVDSYSGFFDNIRGRSTGLDKKLMERGVTDIFVCGIAFDFCAGSSACDAAELGFRTYMIEDLTRSVAPESEEKMRDSLENSNVKLVSAADVTQHMKESALRKSDNAMAEKKKSTDISLSRLASTVVWAGTAGTGSLTPRHERNANHIGHATLAHGYRKSCTAREMAKNLPQNQPGDEDEAVRSKKSADRLTVT